MSYSETDFTEWIAMNRMNFLMNRRKYTPDHVAYLARVVGFDAEMVYRRLSHFDDALARTSIDRRAFQKTEWFESEILMRESLCLQGQWESLDLYETLGIEFDEAA